jgi:hypothetical protein
MRRLVAPARPDLTLFDPLLPFPISPVRAENAKSGRRRYAQDVPGPAIPVAF